MLVLQSGEQGPALRKLMFRKQVGFLSVVIWWCHRFYAVMQPLVATSPLLSVETTWQSPALEKFSVNSAPQQRKAMTTRMGPTFNPGTRAQLSLHSLTQLSQVFSTIFSPYSPSPHSFHSQQNKSAFPRTQKPLVSTPCTSLQSFL